MSGIIGTSANMKSGVLGKPPVGTVIQQVYHTQTAGHESSTGPSSSNSLVKAITTKRANSKIGVTMISYGCHSQSGAVGKAWIMRSSPGESDLQIGYGTPQLTNYHLNRGAGDTNNYEPHVLRIIDEPNWPAGKVITYTARYQRTQGSNLYYFSHNSYYAYTELVEISN